MITERAYAKLNLSLDVTGKLPGGYHALTMVMESVALCDELELELREDGELRLDCSLSWLPCDGRNLALEAARVLREELGQPGLGVSIRLTKRIPVGAGMAGGSTDAAAVLRGLNRLLGRPLDAEALRRVALRVGSDVPYCVQGGSRLAQGRGELLTPLPLPGACRVVIAKPAFSLSTAELFSRIDARSARTRPDTPGLIAALESENLPDAARRMYNVFEDVLPRHCGEIAALRGALLEYGALGSVMTGTGSAVFGLFRDGDCAEKAACALRGRCRDCFVTEFVDAITV